MKEAVLPRTEKATINHYLGAFNHIFERPGQPDFGEYYVQHLQGENAEKMVSYGIRIVMDRKPTAKVVALMDFDDNLVNTTDAKKRFVEGCLELVPQKKREEFTKAYKHINRAARVLPVDATHPERYAPLLDLMAVSAIISSLRNAPQAEISLPQSESEARRYINDLISLQPEFGITTRNEKKDDQLTEKMYFIEKEEQSAGIVFGKKPPQAVRSDVWDAFRQTLAGVNIPEEELENFDVPEDARFIVATFGQLDHQLEKMAKFMRLLKKKGKRLPDEIIVITDGRKEPLLKQIVEGSQGAICVYCDDSVNQLTGMVGVKDVTVVRGLREGTKRFKDPTPDNVHIIVDMTITPHTQLINQALLSNPSA